MQPSQRLLETIRALKRLYPSGIAVEEYAEAIRLILSLVSVVSPRPSGAKSIATDDSQCAVCGHSRGNHTPSAGQAKAQDQVSTHCRWRGHSPTGTLAVCDCPEFVA